MTHKLRRDLKGGKQIRLCDGKTFDFAQESLKWKWIQVKCKKCRKAGLGV